VLFEGGLTGPSPVDRARIGSKHHLLVDAAGLPLAVALTGGNRNDVTQLLPLVDGITPVAGKVGRPRQRPDRIVADRGYDQARNLAYHRRARLEAILGQALNEVDRHIEELRSEGRG
jgi:IS5 family transposase